MAHRTAQRRGLLQWLPGHVAGVLICALFSGPSLADVNVKPASRGYDIDVTGGSSASELVNAIATATGVEIKGKPEDVAIGGNRLRNASLERALRILLPKAPFAVRYDADDTPETIVFLSPQTDGADSGDAMDDVSGTEPELPDPAAPEMEPDLPDTGG